MPARHLAVSALVFACACSSGSGYDGGIPANPPQVAISVPNSTVVDTQLPYSITVSGCGTSGVSLALYDGTTFLKSIASGPNPTTGVLTANDPLFARGLAASLSLVAKATCGDGRSNTSTAAAVTFFPVAQVVSNTAGTQVVPDLFIADGSGASVTFIGCNGDGSLIQIDANGAVKAQVTLPGFRCTNNAWFTDKMSGTRWLLEPGVGVVAFDANLNITASLTGLIYNLAIGPDGDAVSFRTQTSTNGLQRLPHLGGGRPLWGVQPVGYAPSGSQPLIVGGTVIFPEYIGDLANHRGTMTVEAFTYAAGNPAGRDDLVTITYGNLGAPTIPQMFFNQNGSVVYIPLLQGDGTSTVVACASNAQPCQGTNLRWASSALSANVVNAFPFANFTRVAALSAQKTWFLDSANGGIVNPNQLPTVPSGQAVATSVQAGRGTDFYLLNGAAGSLPIEVVGFDAPDRTELFRFALPTGSLAAAVDDSGQAWMRVGTNLVKLLPLSQYRTLHP